MNLNQLLYFSVTARHQHFTRAAEELFISQPSLSYAISSLEDELGIPLFEKKGRNVVLTRQGELFLTHVERALSEIQQGREAISRMNSQIANRIEIAAFSADIGTESLPHLLHDFSSDPHNADVMFKSTQTTDADMIAGLKSMKYDVAFPSELADATDIEAIPLPTQQFYAIMPETHPLAGASELSLSALRDYPLIIGESSLAGRMILHALPGANISSRVNDQITMLRLAADHFGIAISPLTRELGFFQLRAIPINTPEYRCTTYIAYKKNRYISPVLDRFIHFIQSRTV